jgi:hypothetical protein
MVTREWRRLHNGELYDLYSPNIWAISSRTMRWAGHVAHRERCIQEFGGKPEGRRPLGRSKRIREDNIKMDLQEVGWRGMD